MFLILLHLAAETHPSTKRFWKEVATKVGNGVSALQCQLRYEAQFCSDDALEFDTISDPATRVASVASFMHNTNQDEAVNNDLFAESSGVLASNRDLDQQLLGHLGGLASKKKMHKPSAQQNRTQNTSVVSPTFAYTSSAADVQALIGAIQKKSLGAGVLVAIRPKLKSKPARFFRPTKQMAALQKLTTKLQRNADKLQDMEDRFVEDLERGVPLDPANTALGGSSERALDRLLGVGVAGFDSEDDDDDF